jgi:hypothetical protein
MKTLGPMKTPGSALRLPICAFAYLLTSLPLSAAVSETLNLNDGLYLFRHGE